MKLGKRLKSFLERHLVLILFTVSLIYTLPVYDKYWAPYDEGITLVASQCLLAGEVPYKDFFIIMYPPGQVFVLAGLLKLFSFSIIAGRIFAVFVSVATAMLVFLMTRLLTKSRWASLLAWFVTVVALAPRLGAIPSPIFTGMLLALAAIYAYMHYLEELETRWIISAGALAGLSVLFRHDIGAFAIIAIGASLFARLIFNKKTVKKTFKGSGLFLASAFLVVLPCVLYLADKSAIHDAIKSLFLFPAVHQKTAVLSFPVPCFDPRMIFHGSLHFIKINQYYIPILVYLLALLYLLTAFARKTFHEKQYFSLIALLAFGVLTFNQVRIRTDTAHLLTVIQPSAIIFAGAIHRVFLQKFSFRPKVFLRYLITSFILFLFMLLSVKNIDKYIKNTYKKPYRKDIIKTDFRRGTVYVPKEERPQILDTLDFIEEKTLSSDRIFIGNTAHWKDDFGGSIILYFLAARLPSTKYYEFAPGITTDPAVQKEIKNSLVKYDVKLLVLQDVDLGGQKKEEAPKEIQVLDDFIEEHYSPAKKFGKYNIYLRK